MNKEVINNIISMRDYSVSSAIIKTFVKLKLNLNEMLVILFFHNSVSKEVDVATINDEFNLSTEEILLTINSLIGKKIITLDNVKDEQKKIKEIVNMKLFYTEVSELISDKTKKEDDNTIFKLFEQEFGRMLSPTEYEIINAWLDKNTSIDLIKAALKEAVYNGVCNLRYIDKILFEWKKKGYQNPPCITKNDDKKEEKEKLFDYNWLEDEE